jgi:hypothetical protein
MDSEGKRLPELQLIDLLDVFVPGRIQEPVKITRDQPLTGELIQDSTGLYFLAPEEDYRGGGMGSIRIRNLGGKAQARFVGKVVKVSGVFEDGKGVSVKAIALESKPFDD